MSHPPRVVVRRPIQIGQPVVVETPYIGPSDSSSARTRARAEPIRSLAATEICYTKGELHYLLRHAGFESITYHPVDALTRGAIRKGMRLCLRALRIEGIVRPPTYVIVARRS